MKTITLSKLFILFLMFGMNSTLFAQFISPTNSVGVGPSVSPIDWFMSGSTDVSNQNYWAGWATYPWDGVVDNPPNGHEVWVTGFYTEQAWTFITGLTIGSEYTFNFYMCEIRSTAGGPIALYDGVLSVQVAGDEVLYPFTGGADNSWSAESITFTATATSEEIRFKYVPPGLTNGNFWNISFGDDVVEPACDELVTEVSASEICEGEEITLSASSINGGTVTWDGGVMDGVSFEPPVGVTTYTATSDNDLDCIFEIEITVHEFPEIELTADDAEICEGESVVLTLDGEADLIVWDPGEIVPGEPYFPDIGTTIVTVTASNGDCESIETLDIIVNPNPIVEATVDETAICIGDAFIFTGTGADIYTWDLGIIDGEPFTPDETGTDAYYVTGVDSETGCESTDFIYATVYDLPTVGATADFDEVCEGDLVTLNGTGASSYEWDMGVENGEAFAPPLGTTTYTVTGTTIVGCSNSASIDITVHEIPIVDATASELEICEGESIILSGTGADTYEWDLGVIDGESFVPDGTGLITYTVIGTNGPGCEGTASIDIFVHENPPVEATASAEEICLGESITLNGTGADTYVWSDGLLDGIAYSPPIPGEIELTVTGTDESTGCSNTASILITVHDNPDLTYTASSTEICFGESVTLTGEGAISYTWSDGIVNGMSFTPSSVGTNNYTLIGTNEFGCESTIMVPITVIDCEPISADFKLPSHVCIGDCIEIIDLSSGKAVAWDWNFGGASFPNTSTSQNPKICLNLEGVFEITLTVTSETGAVSTLTKSITVYPTPTVFASQDTIIELGGTALLFAESVSDGDYEWTPDYQLECPDCQMTEANPEQNQLYTVRITDNYGCKSSDSVMIYVNYRLNVGVPTAFSPNDDGANDVLFVKGSGLESIHFEIYNRYGERIFESTNQNIGWDGTYLNRDQNPGVFTWVLHYTTVDDKRGKLKGNTTLIR